MKEVKRWRKWMTSLRELWNFLAHWRKGMKWNMGLISSKSLFYIYIVEITGPINRVRGGWMTLFLFSDPKCGSEDHRMWSGVVLFSRNPDTVMFRKQLVPESEDVPKLIDSEKLTCIYEFNSGSVFNLSQFQCSVYIIWWLKLNDKVEITNRIFILVRSQPTPVLGTLAEIWIH